MTKTSKAETRSVQEVLEVLKLFVNFWGKIKRLAVGEIAIEA